MNAAKLVADVAGVDAASVSSATQLTGLTGWDSLKMVRLVVSLEQAISRELTDEEMERLFTVNDVASLLES